MAVISKGGDHRTTKLSMNLSIRSLFTLLAAIITTILTVMVGINDISDLSFGDALIHSLRVKGVPADLRVLHTKSYFEMMSIRRSETMVRVLSYDGSTGSWDALQPRNGSAFPHVQTASTYIYYEGDDLRLSDKHSWILSFRS